MDKTHSFRHLSNLSWLTRAEPYLSYKNGELFTPETGNREQVVKSLRQRNSSRVFGFLEGSLGLLCGVMDQMAGERL